MDTANAVVKPPKFFSEAYTLFWHIDLENIVKLKIDQENS